MAKRKQMDDTEILGALQAAREESLDANSNELASDREEAFNRYFGRPYGNEVEGRSAVVSKDLSDTVDWVMPSLLRIFTNGDGVVEFSPVGPEDELQSQQETDYVNYVVTQENDWFNVFYAAAKDALLLRNGYWKAYWESYEEPKYEEYTGLSVEDLASVVDDEAEVVGKEEREGPDGVVYDLKVRRYHKVGRACIEAVPPEELIVSRRCRGPVHTASYVEHRPRKTRSDLIEMGFNKDWVESLPGSSGQDDAELDAVARNPTDTDSSVWSAYSTEMELVDYRECYIRLDVDGDGIAELRRIVVCGNEIAPGREWNREVPVIPFAGITPNIIPHRHVGRSLADEVLDLQEIKTALLRNLLDNIYLSNNQRTVVGPNVNLADMLVSRPGGIVRTTGIPMQDVMPLQVAPILGQVLPVMDYLDMVKETRTGVGKNTMGLDANTLRESTKGAFLAAQSQASQKIEAIARIFAETGVKHLFLLVHGLLRQNQDKDKVVRLRNQWVPIDPKAWSERYDLRVSVGLGTGSTEERMQKLQMLAMAQGQMAAYGLVGPKEAYATFEQVVKALGQTNAQKYAMDPASPEFQQMQQSKQPQKDPLVAAKEVEVQGRLQGDQMRMQAEEPAKQAEILMRKYEADRKYELEREKLALEAQQGAADRAAEARIEQLKASVDLTIARMDAQMQQVSQQLKFVGDAQNRLALGGPAASALVDTGDGLPNTVDGTMAALGKALEALAAGQRELVEGQGQIAETLSRPKQISLQRDSEGRATGARVS